MVIFINFDENLMRAVFPYTLFQPFFDFFVKYNFTERKKSTSLANNNLPEDYNYFGIDDGVNNLLYMLRYNPFIASALQPVKSDDGVTIGLEIDSFDETTVFGKTSYFLDKKYKRVVATFPPDLSSIESIHIYSLDSYGQPQIHPDDERISAADKANQLMFFLLYNCEVVHATIHVSNTIMLICNLQYYNTMITDYTNLHLSNSYSII